MMKLLVFAFCVLTANAVYSNATICVLTHNHSINGQAVDNISRIYHSLQLSTYHTSTGISYLFYKFKIVWCDMKYYQDLYNVFLKKFESKRHRDPFEEHSQTHAEIRARFKIQIKTHGINYALNEKSKSQQQANEALHNSLKSMDSTNIEPIFIINFAADNLQLISMEIKTLLNQNNFAHLSNIFGEKVTNNMDWDQSVLNQVLDHGLPVNRSKVILRDDIIVKDSPHLMQKQWFAEWNVVQNVTYLISKCGFDTDTMIMFENHRTNQTLVLITDIHTIRNQRHLNFVDQWEPSMILLETEPKQLPNIYENVKYSKNHLNAESAEGAIYVDIIDILQQKKINFSLVLADWKNFNYAIGLTPLLTFLDCISSHKFMVNMNGISMEHFSLGVSENIQKIKNDQEQLMRPYLPHFYWNQIKRRSSMIWQCLMGISQQQFRNNKKIVGVFGAMHVLDIISWHQSNGSHIEEFWPLINISSTPK